MEAPSDRDILGYLTSCSNAGRWGPDDERGTLNLITRETILRALSLVSEGVCVSLSRSIPRWPDDRAVSLHLMRGTGTDASGEGAHYVDDFMAMSIHGYGVTHLDAPAHMSWDGRMYNDRAARLVTGWEGATANSVGAASAGVLGRGVLLDLPRSMGKRWLEPGEAATPEDLDACAGRDGVAIGSGDVLVVRTGADARRAAEPGADPRAGGAGLRPDCVPWLHERGIAALATDAVADASPYPYSTMRFPVHIVGLTAMGLWILDNLFLEDLAETCARLGRWEFLFIAAPLRLQGATGSPVNPIALL